MSEIEAENAFSNLPEDVVLNIFSKLVDDPRNWSRLACVCTKFSSLIRTICWRNKCNQTIPAVVADLFPQNACITSPLFSPPGGWASLHKLAVCCPGLAHSGVLLENSDFGLERDLGPDENYLDGKLFQAGKSLSNRSCSITSDEHDDDVKMKEANAATEVTTSTTVAVANTTDCSWSLYDDLYHDTVYNNVSKSQDDVCDEDAKCHPAVAVATSCDLPACKKMKVFRSLKSHLASEMWNFSREQGNKLLASRFRGDCLYICDWPGCVHTEEKRNYMLFRGVFKNFKKSRVWRTINDGNRSKIDLNCAFCPSNDVWDLHSAFCLRPAYGYHDDGEPVVRAFVCENGHVSGAWTDWPMYT